MKINAGAITDEDLIFKAKESALAQRKTLSQILEDALEEKIDGRTVITHNGIPLRYILVKTGDF